MPRPDAPPVNDNPALQAKLEGRDGGTPNPSPAPVSAPAVDEGDTPPAPALEPGAPADGEPTPQGAPPAEPPELPEPDPAPAQVPKWESTGNDTLDTIGGIFDEKGVDGKTALDEFTKHGEISKETYDGFVEKLGEAQAKLVYSQFKTAFGELKAAAQADAKKIYEAVGGEDSWKQVAAWSKQLPDQERNEYNTLLKNGGKAAQLAAKELKERMMADPQFKSRADLVGSADSPAAAGQPAPAAMLDRRTYMERIKVAEQRGVQSEINKLRDQAKHAMKNNPYWKTGNPK